MDTSQTTPLIKSLTVMYMLKFTKQKMLLLALTTIFFIIIAYYYISRDSSPPTPYVVLRKNHDNSISCHYLKTGDALPAAKDVLMNTSGDSIFFHETSCRGGLNSRQACSIEAAARAHPSRRINVLFSSPVTEVTIETTCISQLKEFKNINFARVHINEYAKNTPLESLVNNGSLEKSTWRVEHTSDVLRYLTLYKWGGIYLDTDMIVVKSFDDLGGNWVGKESEYLVNAAAIGLSKDSTGRKFADILVEELRATFKPDVWIQNGPGVITRVLERSCTTKNISDWSKDTCEFPVYESDYFYPVRYESNQLYFGKEDLKNVDKAYTHHMWNKITKDMPINVDSVYAKLAKTYCPSIYNLFGNDFRKK